MYHPELNLVLFNTAGIGNRKKRATVVVANSSHDNYEPPVMAFIV